MDETENTDPVEKPIGVSTRVPSDGTTDEPDESLIVPRTRTS
jgi:hypothetical protein